MLDRLQSRFVPLRVRMPMVVVALLALCTGGVIVVSYRAVRLSTKAAALDRLRGAADRVAAVYEPSVRRAVVDAQSIGARPAIAHWLATGTGEAAARAALDSVRAARAAPVGVIQITRRDGSRLFTGDGALADTSERAWHTTGISPFFPYRQRVGYAIGAPLVSGNDTLGRVELTQLLSDTGGQVKLIGGLIGKEATLYVGNADGSVWTDMATRIPPPVDNATLAHLLQGNRQTDDGNTLAAGAPLPNTRWVFLVGQPAATALAAATSVMWELALLALAVILAGGIVAWVVIRHITRPIDDLAHAAEELARGHYGPRMSYAGSDEIGRLTVSFNEMAEQIERNQQQLEDQVSERTVALEKALFDLQLAQEENVKRERLAVLGQLAGGVGHELRNPLGVMTNAVFVLESVIPDPHQMVRDYLGILRTQIALSEKIISDLLDFARTKPASRMPTTPEALVRGQVLRLDVPTNVSVELDVPATLPAVHVDPVQIGQVVFNLVMNGVQAMGERGGKLRCRAHHDGNGTVRLEVTDTGPGMPPDVAARVFEPLFTTKTKGLGLGLTVSRMLAENNGGSLTFQSSVGQGTTFYLTMPTAA